MIAHNGISDKALELACTSFLKESMLPFDYGVLMDALNEVRTWYWSDPERHRAGRLDLDNTRRKIFLQAFSILDCPDQKQAYVLADSYCAHHERLMHVFPDTVPTLKTLRASGIRLGLITNGTSQKQRAKIERFSLGHHFDFCLIEGEMGFGKPDPRVYEKALSLLQMDASHVWMVGDNLTWDIEAPQKLGIRSIWVRTPHKHRNAAIVPDIEIGSISELLAFL